MHDLVHGVLVHLLSHAGQHLQERGVTNTPTTKKNEEEKRATQDRMTPKSLVPKSRKIATDTMCARVRARGTENKHVQTKKGGGHQEGRCQRVSGGVAGCEEGEEEGSLRE